MPTPTHPFTLALALGGLLASAAVGAAPPESPPPPRTAPNVESEAERHAAFLATRLETLHAALKLRPDQEEAWRQWSESIKTAHPGWKDKHTDADTLAKLTVPERLEKMVAFARERLSRLEERLAATKSFYAVLSPEQRLTFDKDFNFWPHAGRSGKPGKHSRSLVAPRIGSP